MVKYACSVCSLSLPRPLSSLDAAAIDSLSPPIGELALAAQLIRVAACMNPSVYPSLLIVSPCNAQIGTCPLASIGALVALCYAAAAQPAPPQTLHAQISSELTVLAAALYVRPQQQTADHAGFPAAVSKCVSDLLQRSGQWAAVLEQSLHQRAADAIYQLVAKVEHPHMSACIDAVLPVICEICCHFDATHRGIGARALLHVMSHADKLILRLHKDLILKVCCKRTPSAAASRVFFPRRLIIASSPTTPPFSFTQRL
jgi:hypothetical protein